jgi:hypothetical protein
MRCILTAPQPNSSAFSLSAGHALGHDPPLVLRRPRYRSDRGGSGHKILNDCLQVCGFIESMRPKMDCDQVDRSSLSFGAMDGVQLELSINTPRYSQFRFKWEQVDSL